MKIETSKMEVTIVFEGYYKVKRKMAQVNKNDLNCKRLRGRMLA